MRFHFALSHLPDAASLQVELQGKPFELSPHTEASHADARHDHAILSQVAGDVAKTYGHFADIAPEHFDKDVMLSLRVVRPLQPGCHLQEVVLMAQILPPNQLLAFYKSPIWKDRHVRRHGHHITPGLRATAARRAPHHSARLQSLGIKPVADKAQALDRLVALQELVDSHSTVTALLAHHPDLASAQPTTATYVRDSIISGDEDNDQANALELLKIEIEKTPSWSQVIDCKDHRGNPIKAEYALGKGVSAGTQMQTYSIAENVKTAAAPVAGGAMRLASADMQMRNQLWRPTPGRSAVKSAGGKAPRLKATGSSDAQYKWTVPYQTWRDGMELDKTIRIDKNKINPEKYDVSTDCYNIYLRTLWVAYELFDTGGNSLSKGKRTSWGMFPAVDSIMGIPIPVVPTTVSFELEPAAASFKLYFGSAGVWNRDQVSWDEANVSDRGALLTVALQYAVPTLLAAAGTAIFNTQAFKDIVSPLTKVLLQTLYQLVGPFSVTAGVAHANWQHILFRLANVAACFLTQLALKPLGEWIAKQVVAANISKAWGPVGWAFELAALTLAAEQMLITTGEILASDAFMVAEIKRAIDVKLTLLPDPKHGEAGNPSSAVWPAVSTQYVATLTCQAGTNYEIKGDMEKTTKGTPIVITFPNVPAGGKFQIFVGLYSENGWLAGSWKNDWTPAVPNDGTTLDLKEQHIKEQLVPLSPDTQYVYKEKIAYDGSTFAWTTGSPPTTTMRSLNPNGLSELSALTINQSAYQVGLAWRAAKQHLHPDASTAPVSENQLYAVQNLSVLAAPGKRLKTTQIGFTQKPGIAYSPSVNSDNKVDQSNFILDPRSEVPSKGVLHLRQVLLATDDAPDNHDFGLGDALQSWGYFPLDQLDAVAIHPSKAVIACSFAKHKLMILDLPEAPSPDDKARVAKVLSGLGIREGLMKGPKALAVAPDGRILVLESLNNRVQAFDVKGAAVPSFLVQPAIFNLKKTDIVADLDAGKVPEAFIEALLKQEITYVAPLPDASVIPQLDSGVFRQKDAPLVAALATLQIYLAFEPTALQDPKQSAQIKVLQAGQSWVVTDPRRHAWQIEHKGGALNVYEQPVDVAVEVQKPGARWLLRARYEDRAWMLKATTRDDTLVDVFSCLTYFQLQPGPDKKSLNYLDMAVESQGYMYVLSSINDGSATTDYLLDLYDPEGAFLFRSPDATKTTNPQNIVAGRITVDIFRNLYALSYETLNGPGGGAQPGLAHWMPTPPLFDLPVTEQANFNASNIQAVIQDFAGHKITLTNQAFIKVINPEGYWQVKDGNTIYHAYRSSDALQVYSTPA
jgi:hypothetical protein